MVFRYYSGATFAHLLRHLAPRSPEEQRTEFGLNQVMLAKVIQDSGVDPNSILTNYARPSNSPPSDKEAFDELNKRINKLGLITVVGLNHEGNPEYPFSDYIDAKVLQQKYKGDYKGFIENRIEVMHDLMAEKEGAKVFYLHLHNQAGMSIIEKLNSQHYNITALPYIK